MATLGKLTEYDPEQEEWGSYVERLEFFFTANDITDAEKKKAILLSSSGSKTYKLFRGLTAPAKPGDMTFAELVKLMKNQPKPNPIAERFHFNTRDRQPEESVANYVMELRRLTEHCEYGTSLNDMLRDCLVCGIKHDRIHQCLLSEGAELTLERALQIAQSMESAIKQSTVIQNYQHRTEGVHKVSTQERSYKECFRCGGRHAVDHCNFKNKECFFCKNIGHTARKCRKKANADKQKGGKVEYTANIVDLIEEDQAQDVDDIKNIQHTVSHQSLQCEEDMFDIYQLGLKWVEPLTVNVGMNGKNVSMEVDTGASLTVISEMTMKQIPHLEITPVAAKLCTYTGEVITPVGQADVNVKYEGQVKVLTVIVTPGSGPSLLGRNWLHHIRLNWKQIFNELKLSEENESVELKSILDKYATVFKEELGTMKGTEVHINLKLDAKPRFCKARPVPYALKPEIDTELDRLVKEGVYVPVGYSRWAAPIVPVLKNDGTVRICGDYKQTINKPAHCENYPLPRTEDLLATLNGGQKFSKLDLSHTYQQLLLDNESREYLTVNTHRGLFQPTRLQFEVHSASRVFQREMEKRLTHIPFTSVRVDDISFWVFRC